MITRNPRLRIAWGLVAAFAALAIVRGPVRALRSSGDLAAPFAATRAFLAGQNPYDHRVLDSVLAASGRETDSTGRPAFTPSLYPPPTFVVLAPFSLLSWNAVRWAWLATTLTLFVAHLLALMRIAGASAHSVRGVLLVAAVLALAPYHTGIALGQLAMASVALLVIAIDQIGRGRDVSGGIALGVATIMKPQLAAPFILYYLVRRRARPALMAAGVAGVVAGIAVGWLALRDVSWYASWAVNAAAELNGGAIDPAGPLNFHMVDLRPLLVAVTKTHDAGAIGAVAGLIVAGLLFTWSRAIPASRELLVLSAFAALVLLVGYHRFYDAALLCLPLAWLAREGWSDSSARAHTIVAASCAVFVVPGAVLLYRIAGAGQTSLWWNAILLRHENWALVTLQVALLTVIYRAYRSTPTTAAATATVQQAAPTRATR
jgi:hypothetical protein